MLLPALHPLAVKPANRQPDAGAARRRRCVPRGNSTRHVRGQSMPRGELRTMPRPVIVTNATSR